MQSNDRICRLYYYDSHFFLALFIQTAVTTLRSKVPCRRRFETVDTRSANISEKCVIILDNRIFRCIIKLAV